MKSFLLLKASILIAATANAQEFRKLPWMDESAAEYHAEQKKLSGKSQEAALYRVERYLNELGSLKATFRQFDDVGNTGTGTFYLKRPGKMRWQYDPPVPVLMVSSGSYLTYIDFEIEQVTHIPLDSTMAGLITKERIDLHEDVTVRDIRAGAGNIRLVLTPKDNPEEGVLILELEEEPMRLTRMILGDASGHMTRVDLSEAEYNLALDDVLFEFEDPRESRTRIRR